MERLQKAIEKARSERDKGAPPTRQRDRERPQVARMPMPEAWAALAAFTFRKRALNRRRVFTLTSSADAAPYDLMRTRLLQQAKQNNWKRIAFVSPHAGCGKTTTVANLAFSMARQTDTHTMVFDFDLRRRGLTELFRQKPAHGMSDVLQGRVPFADLGVRHGKNVAIGFNRAPTRDASEILQSPQTTEVLSDLEAIYQPDLMLFDMPPLLASDDNYGFLQNVDAALILTAAEKTTLTQIDVAERQVAELTNVMGIVLNKCRYTNGAYGHEYGYY